MKAIEKYARASTLEVPKYAIERAIGNLSEIEALVLIRAAYGYRGQLCTLREAREIYAALVVHG